MVRSVVIGFALVVASAVGATMSEPSDYTPWTPVLSIEQMPPGAHATFNSQFQDGCPAPSRNGLTFYFASNRDGEVQGDLDIWVSRRASVDEPWGAPENLGFPVNTGADEFCPGPTRDGHGLLFVSTRPGCGGGDMYISRRRADGTWTDPANLGCHVNSSADEASPILVEYDDGTTELYFSSTRAGGFSSEPEGATIGDSDIYVSLLSPDGSLGVPQLVPDINSAAQDARPHVRRDGLEIFFDSNRTSGGWLGGFDILSATRASAFDPWSTPFNLGPNVNSGQNDTRPYLSWDARRLYIGSTRPGEGSADIYVATREKVRGKH